MNEYIELRHLRYFIAVAEGAAFAVDAAKALQHRQPQLSPRSVKKWSRYIGVPFAPENSRTVALLRPADVVRMLGYIVRPTRTEGLGDGPKEWTQGGNWNVNNGFIGSAADVLPD